MNSYCSNPDFCPNGNCIGCKNGQQWCNDPRCSPNCVNCSIPAENSYFVNALVFIIIIVLLALLFVVWFVYGPSFFVSHSDHEKANVYM